jgi:hypothetical protein
MPDHQTGRPLDRHKPACLLWSSLTLGRTTGPLAGGSGVPAGGAARQFGHPHPGIAGAANRGGQALTIDVKRNQSQALMRLSGVGGQPPEAPALGLPPPILRGETRIGRSPTLRPASGVESGRSPDPSAGGSPRHSRMSSAWAAFLVP